MEIVQVFSTYAVEIRLFGDRLVKNVVAFHRLQRDRRMFFQFLGALAADSHSAQALRGLNLERDIPGR